MIKIPQTNKKIVVTNGKDAYQGAISYTKNINLDEEGYFKLSAPMVSILSNEAANGGEATLGDVVEIFGYDDHQFKIVTDQDTFNLSMSALTVATDSGMPNTSKDSRVVTWDNGSWFVGASDVYEYTGATGTTVYTQRINALLGYIELFVNRNNLVGEFAGGVRQYDTSFAHGGATTPDLVLPDAFEVTGMAYSNNMMGIITRSAKNQGNAYFFTWDGTSTAANAGYPVNDSFIIGVAAYKNSWLILTSAGELLYFNGGGFETLGTLPQFQFEDDFVSLGVNNSITLGRIMCILGDIAFINAPSLAEHTVDNSAFRPHASGGVYCLDPNVGLYHRHAPSYSRYYKEAGTSASNVITLTKHWLETGDEVWLSADDNGLTGKRIYYAIKVTDTTIKLANTYADAFTNTAVTVTDGSIDLWYVRRKDFGIEMQTLADTGVVKKDRSYEGFSTSGVLPFFMTAYVRPNDVTGTRINVVNALAPKMSNRGLIVTARFQSNDLSDNYQAVAVKYDKLLPQNKIVVKAKVVTDKPIIIGDSTLYNSSYTGEYVIWQSPNQFETDVDLSTVNVGDEVHIFDGMGAGQEAFITEITLVGSTYQITLDEDMRGFVSLGKSCVAIDKWKKLGVITSLDTEGFKRFSLNEPSPECEVKLELRGVETKVSEIQVIPVTQVGSV